MFCDDVSVKHGFFFSVGCYVNTTMPPPADIVKVAIEWPGANAQLIEMDQVSICIKHGNISSFPVVTQLLLVISG